MEDFEKKIKNYKYKKIDFKKILKKKIAEYSERNFVNKKRV